MQTNRKSNSLRSLIQRLNIVKCQMKSQAQTPTELFPKKFRSLLRVIKGTSSCCNQHKYAHCIHDLEKYLNRRKLRRKFRLINTAKERLLYILYIYIYIHIYIYNTIYRHVFRCSSVHVAWYNLDIAWQLFIPKLLSVTTAHKHVVSFSSPLQD